MVSGTKVSLRQLHWWVETEAVGLILNECNRLFSSVEMCRPGFVLQGSVSLDGRLFGSRRVHYNLAPSGLVSRTLQTGVAVLWCRYRIIER